MAVPALPVPAVGTGTALVAVAVGAVIFVVVCVVVVVLMALLQAVLPRVDSEAEAVHRAELERGGDPAAQPIGAEEPRAR